MGLINVTATNILIFSFLVMALGMYLLNHFYGKDKGAMTYRRMYAYMLITFSIVVVTILAAALIIAAVRGA